MTTIRATTLAIMIALTAALVPSSRAAGAPCQLVRMATMDAHLDGSARLYIPAEMAGRKTTLVIDTGGSWSLIKADFADELKLQRNYNQSDSNFVDAAGKSMRQYVRVPGLKLGELAFKGPVDFIVMEGYLGDDRYAGTIGLNIIGRFDVELDNELKRVNLFHPNHCPRIGAYGANEYVELPLINANGRPETKIDIDGEQVRALVDTGSTHTFVGLEFARRKWGIMPETPGVTASRDMLLPSGKTVRTYRYSFKSLAFSGFHFDDVEVVLTEGAEGLTLGMRELSQLHLYFSFKEERLYATTATARRR